MNVAQKLALFVEHERFANLAHGELFDLVGAKVMQEFLSIFAFDRDEAAVVQLD